MKIQVLIENTENAGFVCEHGLSLYIEHNDKKILLDAGATGAFVDNANKMQVRLDKLDYAVLSHGHYDHAGGFERFLKEFSGIKVYAMQSAVNKYYSGSGGKIHEIGIPQSILDKYLDRFIFVNDVTKLSEGIYIVPHFFKNLQMIGERAELYKECNGKLMPDDFCHECSLVLEKEDGLTIFNSCSHAGIINIIREVREIFPEKNINCFVGGLHLKGKVNNEIICTYSENEMKQMADYLKNCNIKKLYTGHCTGEPAIKLLQKYLGDTVDILVSGKII